MFAGMHVLFGGGLHLTNGPGCGRDLCLHTGARKADTAPLLAVLWAWLPQLCHDPQGDPQQREVKPPAPAPPPRPLPHQCSGNGGHGPEWLAAQGVGTKSWARNAMIKYGYEHRLPPRTGLLKLMDACCPHRAPNVRPSGNGTDGQQHTGWGGGCSWCNNMTTIRSPKWSAARTTGVVCDNPGCGLA